MEAVEECHLCCRAVDHCTGNTVTPLTSLWSYMYHKNVREVLLPRPCISEKDAAKAQNRGPKLTFTFSFGGCDNNQGDMLLCDACLKAVNQLETLHQQLESCKKMITAQVERIELVCERSTPIGMEGKVSAIRGNRKQESLWRKGSTQLIVALAGTIIGNDNISQMLHCLGSLCNGINDCQGNSSASCQPADGAYAHSGIPDEPSVKSDPRQLEPDQNSDKFHHASDAFTEVDVGIPFSHTIKVDPCTNVTLIEEESSLNEEQSLEYDSQPEMEDPLMEESEHQATLLSQSPNATFDLSDTSYPSTRSISRRANPVRKVRQSPSVVCGEKPVVVGNKKPCHVCGKLIYHKNLAAHERLHTGYRPFRCEFCGKSFTQCNNLSDHRRIHTGEKRFSCKLCNRSFTRMRSVKLHMKNIHGRREEEVGSS